MAPAARGGEARATPTSAGHLPGHPDRHRQRGAHRHRDGDRHGDRGPRPTATGFPALRTTRARAAPCGAPPSRASTVPVPGVPRLPLHRRRWHHDQPHCDAAGRRDVRVGQRSGDPVRPGPPGRGRHPRGCLRPPVFLTSRTFNQTASGTYGQYFPSLAAAVGLGLRRTGDSAASQEERQLPHQHRRPEPGAAAVHGRGQALHGSGAAGGLDQAARPPPAALGAAVRHLRQRRRRQPRHRLRHRDGPRRPEAWCGRSLRSSTPTLAIRRPSRCCSPAVEVSAASCMAATLFLATWAASEVPMPREGETWCEVQTPHFVVVSNSRQAG